MADCHHAAVAGPPSGAGDSKLASPRVAADPFLDRGLAIEEHGCRLDNGHLDGRRSMGHGISHLGAAVYRGHSAALTERQSLPVPAIAIHPVDLVVTVVIRLERDAGTVGRPPGLALHARRMGQAPFDPGGKIQKPEI